MANTNNKSLIEMPRLNVAELAAYEEKMTLFLASQGLHMHVAFAATYTGATLITDEDGAHGLARIRVAALLMDCVPAEHMGAVRLAPGTKLTPEAIWVKITALSLGEVKGQRGPMIHQRYNDFALLSVDADGNEVPPLSEAGISLTLDAANEIMAQARSYTRACTTASIQNEFPITEPMMIARITALVVAADDRFRPYLKSWRPIKTLAKLRAELQEDAIEVRSSSGPGRPTARAFIAADAMAQLTATMAAMKAEMNAMNAGGAGRGGSGGSGGGGGAGAGRSGGGSGSVRHGHAAMSNRDQPPDQTGRWKWCDNHGMWSTSHDTASCRIGSSRD